MKFSVSTKPITTLGAACIVIGIYENEALTEQARQIDKNSGGMIQKALKRGDIYGHVEETLMLHNVPGGECESVLLVGLGEKEKFNEYCYKKILQVIANVFKTRSYKKIIVTTPEIPCKHRNAHWKTRMAIEQLSLINYQFNEFKSKKIICGHLKEIVFTIYEGALDQVKTAIHEGKAIISGMKLAKDLANSPPNVCTPTYLAETAKKLAKGRKNMSVKVLGERELAKMGMGAFVSVAKGSEQPGKLIILEYKGRNAKNKQPYVLVGKGITFDSGGISLKPGALMDEMKFDMAGAASVLGTMQSIMELELPIYLICVIAAAENLPSGKASKPGDIVKTLSGQTVEILNTDAEGRLVLCDALTYIERFKPKAVIDIATLTGAIIMALGNFPGGLFSNDEELSKAIQEAADNSYDRVWPMPLWDDYQPLLNSNFADMANISQGRFGGSITAAAFLSRFTQKYKWAHLDIAGIAWLQGENKGATGRPVPLLTQYLIDQAHAG